MKRTNWNMCMIDVSVIIPVFNRIKTIGRAIDSVLCQTFQGNVEIIVSDDGSTDGTLEYLKKNYLDKIVLLEKESNEQGAAAARNRGIKKAQGKYICFLDSDDFYNNNFLKCLYEAINNGQNLGYAFCRVNKLEKKDDEYLETPWTKTHLNSFAKKYHVLYSAGCINTISIMILKEIIDRVGLFDASLRVGEDSDMWLRISEVSNGVFVDVVGSVYCISGFSNNQLTSVKSDKVFFAIRVLERALYRYKIKNLNDKTRLFLIYRNLYILKTTQKPGFVFSLYRQISVRLKLLLFHPLCYIVYMWESVNA